MSLAQGGRAQVLPKFWGSLLFMHTSFDAELPNLTYTCRGGACVLGSATPPISRVEFQRSPILEVLLYLWLYLMQNDEVRQSACFRSVMPLHCTDTLHHVSNSRVSCVNSYALLCSIEYTNFQQYVSVCVHIGHM